MTAPLSTFMTQLLDDSINRNSFGETSNGADNFYISASTDSADSTVMTDNLDHSGSSSNKTPTRKETHKKEQQQQAKSKTNHNTALKKARKNFANTTSNSPLQPQQSKLISNDDGSLSMASATLKGSSSNNVNLLQTSSASLTNFMTQLLNDSEIDKLIAQGESNHGDYSTSQTTSKSNTSSMNELPQLMSITSDNCNTQQRPSLILSKGAANVLASAVKSIQKQQQSSDRLTKSSESGMDADAESTARSSVHDPYTLLKSVYRGGGNLISNNAADLAHSLNVRRGGLSRSNSDGSISVTLSKTDLQKSSSQSLSIAGLRQELQKSASIANLRHQMKRLQSTENIYKGSMELDYNNDNHDSGEDDNNMGESTDLDASGLSSTGNKKKKRHSRSTTRHRSKSASGNKKRAKSGSKKRAPSMENSGETTTTSSSSKRNKSKSRGRTPNGTSSKTKRKSQKEKSGSLMSPRSRSTSQAPRSRSTSQAPRSRSTSQGKTRSQDKTPRSRSHSKTPRSGSQSQSHSKTPRKRRSSDPRVASTSIMKDVSTKDKRERRSSDSMRDNSIKDVLLMKRDKSKSRSSTRKGCMEEPESSMMRDASMKDVSMKRDKSKSRSSTRKSCMEESSSRREGGSGRRQRTSSAGGDGSGRRQRSSSATKIEDGGSERRQRTSSADGGSGRRQRTSTKGDCPATPRVSSKSPAAGARTSRKASAVQDPSYCLTPKTPKHKRASSGAGMASKSPSAPRNRGGEHASKRSASKDAAPRTPRTPRTPKTPKTPSSARRSSGKKSASRSKSFDISTNPETAEVAAAVAKSPLRRTKTTAMENMITAAPAMPSVRQRRASQTDMDTSFQKMMEAAAKINAITRSMDASSKSHATQTRRRNSLTTKDSEAHNNNSYNSSADFSSPKPSRAPLRRNVTVDASTPATLTPRALTRRRNSLSMNAGQTNTPRRSNKEGSVATNEAAGGAKESRGASRRNRNQISKQQAQQVLRQAVVEEIKAKEEAKQPPLPAPPANPHDTATVSTAEPAAEGAKKEATWISRRKKSLFLSQQSQARISAGV